MAAAVRAATGGVAEMSDGSRVVLPYGMDEATFLDAARLSYAQAAQRAGITESFDGVGLQAVANGRYVAVLGMSPILTADGSPLVLDVSTWQAAPGQLTADQVRGFGAGL
jgi:hypothetical protein